MGQGILGIRALKKSLHMLLKNPWKLELLKAQLLNIYIRTEAACFRSTISGNVSLWRAWLSVMKINNLHQDSQNYAILTWCKMVQVLIAPMSLL